MPAPLDLIGHKFGQLTVASLVWQNNRRRWRCVCDCGGETVTTTGNLRSGNSQSCGCRKRAVLGERSTSHGMSGTRTYRIWKAMHTRCSNPNTRMYHRYGGRGIAVCGEWSSFEHFFADMGEAPKGMSIERVDNDKGYEKGNCRWATPAEQAHNMYLNRWVTYQGETKILADWARQFSVDPSTLRKQWVRRGIITP